MAVPMPRFATVDFILFAIKKWSGEKKSTCGCGGASRAGRAQRVIGFTGVSPVQLLALGANGMRLDLEECARRLPPSSVFPTELTDDACSRLSTRPSLCRRCSENWPPTTAFSFLSEGWQGLVGWTGNQTHSCLSVASHSSGMMVLSGAWCTIPVLGCILVVFCTTLYGASCHFLENSQKI